MAHVPPKTVGSKSPTVKSSIFRSPAAVRIVVPFRKHGRATGVGLAVVAAVVCADVGLGAVKLAKIADPPIAPILMRFRRDRRIPVGTFSRAVMFAYPVYVPGTNVLGTCWSALQRAEASASYFVKDGA